MKKMIRIGALIFLFVFSASFVMADWVTVPAAAFRGDKETTDFDINVGEVLKTATNGYLYAPVNLPNGAIIKNMRLLYIDNSASYNVTAILYRTNLFTGINTSLFSVVTSGASTSRQYLVDSTTTYASDRKVYTNVLQYNIQLYFSGGDSLIRVIGITIEYE
jgi:hypothetical protein